MKKKPLFPDKIETHSKEEFQQMIDQFIPTKEYLKSKEFKNSVDKTVKALRKAAF